MAILLQQIQLWAFVRALGYYGLEVVTVVDGYGHAMFGWGGVKHGWQFWMGIIVEEGGNVGRAGDDNAFAAVRGFAS